MQHRMTAAVVATAALVLAGCGDDDDFGAFSGDGPSTSSSVTQEHNEADVAFLQGMIPHHEQAVDIAGLADTRAASDQVKTLARRIEAAQDPEIQMMNALLTAFGAAIPEAEPADIHGVLTEQALRDLEAATGAAFDRLFVALMIENHRGAISMSELELSRGKSKPVEQLAEQIIENQQAELATMTGLQPGG